MNKIISTQIKKMIISINEEIEEKLGNKLQRGVYSGSNYRYELKNGTFEDLLEIEIIIEDKQSEEEIYEIIIETSSKELYFLEDTINDIASLIEQFESQDKKDIESVYNFLYQEGYYKGIAITKIEEIK